MSKYIMSWSELYKEEKVAVGVAIAGLSGGAAIVSSGHLLIGDVVIVITVVVGFVLLGKAEKRREKDE